MKYVYILCLILLITLILFFKVQNIDTVTVSLFSASLTLPVSILIFLVYLLGMFTGAFLLSLLKCLWQKITAKE